MEANPFLLPQESRLTASESAACLKTFDLCLFEHRTGGTELPPVSSTSGLVLGRLVLAGMQGKGTGLSDFFLLQHTTKRDLSRRHM